MHLNLRSSQIISNFRFNSKALRFKTLDYFEDRRFELRHERGSISIR